MRTGAHAPGIRWFTGRVRPTTDAELPGSCVGRGVIDMRIAMREVGSHCGRSDLSTCTLLRMPGGEVSAIATVDDGLDAPPSVEIATDAEGNTVACIANFSIAMGGPLGADPSIQSLDVE